MTGAVTYEQIWALFGVVGVLGSVVAGVVAFLWRIVSALRTRYDADRGGLEARVKAGETDLTAYKQHVAETYASKSGVSQQISRLEDAVNGIADKVDKSSDRITERIDRLLENQAQHPAASRRRTGS